MSGPATPTLAPFLNGVMVVEVGHRIAVGACGNLLMHLGATVVAIEPAASTVDGKWRNRAGMMTGKASIVLDRANVSDMREFDALVASADIVLLSTDDGASDPLAWRRPNAPAQVVADITAFGHGGPCEGRGGSEAAMQAETGIVDTTGPSHGDPVHVGVPVLETMAAVYAAASIMLALRVRRLQGFGQRIDIALADVGVNALANFLALHFGRLAPTRSGNRHPLYAPWGSYHASDGYLLACSVTDEQFARLCRAMAAPDLAEDRRYASSTGRLAHFRELDRRINAWAAERSVADCERMLAEVGVAAGGVISLAGLATEPNLVHRRSVVEAADSEGNQRIQVPDSPLRSDRLPRGDTPRYPARDGDRQAVARLVEARRHAAHDDRGASVRPAAALTGVRVVEIGHYTVAPLASRILGSFGADVVKVEPPGGDAVRSGPPLRDDGQAYIFALSNTDKRGLVLDLRDDSQRERLHALLERADILVENLRPGALERLGLGAEVLRARHPRLVYCAITGFGHDSVYQGRAALDSVIQAMSGMMSLTTVAGEPTKTGISTSDNLGGLVGMLACLVGLEMRDRTGIAAHFDISMQDASSWMTLLTCGGAPAPPARVLRTADGHVLVEGPADVLASLSTDVSTQRRASFVAEWSRKGVAVTPVLTVPEVIIHPHTTARELIVERPTSDGTAWTVLNSPMRLLVTAPAVRCVMPRLGADDASVLADLAGEDAQKMKAPMRVPQLD